MILTHQTWLKLAMGWYVANQLSKFESLQFGQPAYQLTN